MLGEYAQKIPTICVECAAGSFTLEVSGMRMILVITIMMMRGSTASAVGFSEPSADPAAVHVVPKGRGLRRTG